MASTTVDYTSKCKKYGLNEILFGDGCKAITDADFTYNPDTKVLTVGTIQFDLTPTHVHSEGSIHWDNDDKTLNIDTEVTGTVIQVGQEMVLRATNKTGVTLTNGQVVYVNGAQGQRPTVALGDADNEATADSTIGIVTSDISNNNTGYVTVFGLVRDLDTSSFTAGDIVYLSQTAGEITNVKPSAPAHSVRIGIVLYDHATEGIIFCHISTGSDLKNLHDVSLSGLADLDLLQYDNANSLWQNITLSSLTSSITPGSDTEIIFNDGGTLGADSKLSYNKTIGKLLLTSTLNNIIVGDSNTALGLSSGSSNVIISRDTSALFNGSLNIIIGRFAGASLTNADSNTLIGYEAGKNITTGGGNVAIGLQSMTTGVVTGSNNFAIGTGSLKNLTSGTANVAIGSEACETITTNSYNVAIGTNSLRKGNASTCVSIGYNTAYFVSGANNTYVGAGAGFGASGLTNGLRNTAIGSNAAAAMRGGNFNTIVGYGAAESITNGSGNVIIGYNASKGSITTQSNLLWVHNDNSVTPLVYGEFNTGIFRINSTLQVSNPAATGYAFPTTDGTANQYLKTDGAGALSFATLVSSSIGTSPIDITSSTSTSDSNDIYYIDTSSAAVTLTLHTPTTTNKIYIKCIDDTNTCTISGSIDDDTSIELIKNESLTLHYSSSKWRVL